MADNIAKLEADLARLKQPPVSSDRLFRALKLKHAGDVLVGECKDGPTQTASHRRLDAWVLLKTWSPITMIGYEIKVSRSDWLGDKKIPDYLPLCHYLNIVAPKGLIKVEELLPGVGLLELAGVGDGQRLITRKKAIWRDIALPSQLLVYVLMCRVKIVHEEGYGGTYWRVDQLKRWVEEKAERRELSYAVNGKIRARFAEQESRLQQIEQRQRELETVKKRIIELGFDPERPVSTWETTERLKQLAGAVDEYTIRNLASAEQALKTTRETLEKIRQGIHE